MICILTQNCSGDKIENNGIGGTCSTYGGRGEVSTGFLWGKLRKRDHLEGPGVDGRIILRWIFRKWDVGCGSMDWIALAQERDWWRGLVNAMINLGVPQNVGNILTS
jgi:hypothetical protein